MTTRAQNSRAAIRILLAHADGDLPLCPFKNWRRVPAKNVELYSRWAGKVVLVGPPVNFGKSWCPGELAWPVVDEEMLRDYTAAGFPRVWLCQHFIVGD